MSSRLTTNWLRSAALALLVITARSCEHLLVIDNHRIDFLAAQRTTWMQWAFADRSFSRECLVVFAANQSVAPGQLANATGVTTVALPQFGRDTWRRREWMLSWALRAHGRRLATLTVTEGDVFVCWSHWRELVRGVAAAAAAAPIVVGYRHRDGRLFDMHFAVLSARVAAALAAALGDRAWRRAATRDALYAVPPGQLGACASACVARARGCATSAPPGWDATSAASARRGGSGRRRAATAPRRAPRLSCTRTTRGTRTTCVARGRRIATSRRGRTKRRTCSLRWRARTTRPNCARCHADGRFRPGCAR